MPIRSSRTFLCVAVSACTIVALGTIACSKQKSSLSINVSHMSKLATVSPRYLSYNIEMVGVTGGDFWKPYKSGVEEQPAPKANKPIGMNKDLFQYSPPIDLDNARLRNLAKALGPSYIRVSGSWANNTYFQNNNLPALKKAPKGFKGVLTRKEWKGVIDFSRAVDGEIVTSMTTSLGTRNAKKVWTPNQAKALFDYTKSLGASIAATEFMNEPNFSGPGTFPGYDAADYARDIKVFGPFLRKESPHTIFLGPGSVGEGVSLLPSNMTKRPPMIPTEDLMKATGPAFDAFSFHIYGAVSRRCGGGISPDEALTNKWLNRAGEIEAFYANLRNTYLPGKPMWVTETAEAACGGDPIAGQFVDTFRFLNQMGTLAQKGVQVVMHDTLVRSNYGLLEENTLDPTPDYWAALLWKHLMGTTVLDPGVANKQHLRIYAQCSDAPGGGVTVLALNMSKTDQPTLTLPANAERYTLTAPSLTSTETLLNGTRLMANANGTIPAIAGQHVNKGTLRLPPLSSTFLVMPSAHNEVCQ